EEIDKLLSVLSENARSVDEIIILVDETNVSKEVDEFLRDYDRNDYARKNDGNVATLTVGSGKFGNDFAEWKNRFFKIAEGDYIFNIDADELPHTTLLQMLPKIVENNDLDLIYVPRINIVNGMTDDDVRNYKWSVNERGWIQFP